MEDNYEELKNVIKENIEKDLTKQYELGLIAGFSAALITLYSEIKDINNAKKIKKYIKDKQENVQNILNNIELPE